MRILGFHRDGGLAELVAVPKSSLVPVPPTLAEHVASLAEPLACTLNAMERVGLCPGERVLILGAGPVGLMMGLAVQSSRALPFIVDPDGLKLEKSKMFRLKTGIEASSTISGDAFDVAVNAAPALSTLSEGMARVRSGGRFCLFSGISGTESVALSLVNELHYREIQMCGAYGCTRSQMERALSLLEANRDAAERLIEERISLNGVQDAFFTILAGRVLKYVVELEGGKE
jgi:threonine dehydrogenase-like Zn-dependent dehydrogenase